MYFNYLFSGSFGDDIVFTVEVCVRPGISARIGQDKMQIRIVMLVIRWKIFQIDKLNTLSSKVNFLKQ